MIHWPRWLEWLAEIWAAFPSPLRWGAISAGLAALAIFWWTR